MNETPDETANRSALDDLNWPTMFVNILHLSKVRLPKLCVMTVGIVAL